MYAGDHRYVFPEWAAKKIKKPSFSPDDSSVLFCSERRGNWDLSLVRLGQ
ncbi:MAG: PD40 domain-containing protein [Planctomycetes bacterium]|nr:PD40 domain-containing protein [Planctomycetota bacterium]